MTTYLDTSVVVSLIIDDTHSTYARSLVGEATDLLLSDLSITEFSSALALRFRTGTLGADEVQDALRVFDTWRGGGAQVVELQSTDWQHADRLIRTLDHALKAPDAAHVAVAVRLGARLATFDATMAREARRLNVSIIGIDT